MSRMKASMHIENPDDVEMTMQITMPLKDWQRFYEQIHASPQFVSFPASEVCGMIYGLVTKAYKHIEPDQPSETA